MICRQIFHAGAKPYPIAARPAVRLQVAEARPATPLARCVIFQGSTVSRNRALSQFGAMFEA